jgi:hypothetical protein
MDISELIGLSIVSALKTLQAIKAVIRPTEKTIEYLTFPLMCSPPLKLIISIKRCLASISCPLENYRAASLSPSRQPSVMAMPMLMPEIGV